MLSDIKLFWPKYIPVPSVTLPNAEISINNINLFYLILLWQRNILEKKLNRNNNCSLASLILLSTAVFPLLIFIFNQHKCMRTLSWENIFKYFVKRKLLKLH